MKYINLKKCYQCNILKYIGTFGFIILLIPTVGLFRAHTSSRPKPSLHNTQNQQCGMSCCSGKTSCCCTGSGCGNNTSLDNTVSKSSDNDPEQLSFSPDKTIISEGCRCPSLGTFNLTFIKLKQSIGFTFFRFVFSQSHFLSSSNLYTSADFIFSSSRAPPTVHHLNFNK